MNYNPELISSNDDIMPELISSSNQYDDMPELIFSSNQYDDIPELISSSNQFDDMPELISSSNQFDDMPELFYSNFGEIFDYMAQLRSHLSSYRMRSEMYINNYERVLQESFEMQPAIKKNNNIIDIKSKIYSEIEDKTSKDCCICLCDFEDDCEVSILNCNHILHKNCIVEWGQYKQDCPVCRHEI